MYHCRINGDNDIERIYYMGGIEKVLPCRLLDGYARPQRQ